MPTLNWLTREEDLVASKRVPYRLLKEVPELSYTEKDPATENGLLNRNFSFAFSLFFIAYGHQIGQNVP